MFEFESGHINTNILVFIWLLLEAESYFYGFLFDFGAKIGFSGMKIDKPAHFYLQKTGLSILVPVVGVEPTRCCHHWILNPARLPIPSHRHGFIFTPNLKIATRKSGGHFGGTLKIL